MVVVMWWLVWVNFGLAVSANIAFGYLIYKLRIIIKMARTVYSQMGKQSAVTRQAKMIEKGITENLFQMEAPEVKVILQLLPEDIKDRLDEIDPEVWLYLLEKYKPLIQTLLQKQNPVKKQHYHIE